VEVQLPYPTSSSTAGRKNGTAIYIFKGGGGNRKCRQVVSLSSLRIRNMRTHGILLGNVDTPNKEREPFIGGAKLRENTYLIKIKKTCPEKRLLGEGQWKAYSWPPRDIILIARSFGPSHLDGISCGSHGKGVGRGGDEMF